MSYEKVEQAKKTIIGTKQTVKAIRAGIVTEVIIAQDADERIIAPVMEEAAIHGIRVTYVDSMKKLRKYVWHTSRRSRGCDYWIMVFVDLSTKTLFLPQK